MNICVLGKVVALFYIPTRMYEVSSFSTFLPTFVVICFSNIDVGSWMRNVIVIVICISPITNDVMSTFLYIFFEEVSTQILCPFFNYENSPYVLNTNSPIRYIICQYFLPFSVLSFIVLMMLFKEQKFFIMMKSSFFPLVTWGFGIISKETFHKKGII